MKIRLPQDPVISCFTLIDSFINNLFNNDDLEEMDAVYRRILSINGHKTDNAKVIEKEILPDRELVISFVYNARCNSKTMYYDIVTMYGVTNIFVFADYFTDLYRDDEENDIDKIAKDVLGRSNHYEAIKKICYIILDYIYPYKLDNLSISGFNYHQRYPLYIAAKVLDNLYPLTESDIDSEVIMKPEELMKDIKTKNITSLLLGIE